MRQEVMVIPRIFKRCEISWLKGGKSSVDKWSDEDEEKGGDKGDDLFQSEFSWLFSWSFQSKSSY